MATVSNIKIKAGVHNEGHYADNRITEEELNALKEELADVLHKHIPSSSAAWIEVTYTKHLGDKINS
jgi:hypothetical protein